MHEPGDEEILGPSIRSSFDGIVVDRAPTLNTKVLQTCGGLVPAGMQVIYLSSSSN